MKIAIIGGGLTGLTAAYELVKQGHQVTVFEKDATLGGLANGFRKKGWDWSLEQAYHHLFTNDTTIINLIKELRLEHKLIVKRPITANFYHGAIYQFDSAMNLLQFPHLSVIDKIRTGALLAILKINPFWRPLEWVTAKQLFLALGGKRAWETIWEPLMIGKFGTYSDSVAASWLWARIKKRTPKLYYIEGGFHTLITKLERTIKQHGGKIFTGTFVNKIEKNHSSFIIHYSVLGIHHSSFDRILLTVPTPIAAKLFPHSSFIIHHSSLLTIPHLHAQTLILETKEPILKDVYWLNILDRSFPFLAVVAHTNFMDKKYYDGHQLTYFGNYLPEGHRYLSMNARQLLKEFLPFIHRLSPDLKFEILNLKLFVGMYAQPVHQIHYSQKIPPVNTPIPGIYLANMDFIYPWDRGTNYAVDLGQKAAQIISQ